MTLPIKNLTSNPTPWFALFNLLVYTSAFLARILRDTLLFTKAGDNTLFSLTPSGAMVFPIALVINAVLMTWFAGRLGDWWERLGTCPVLVAGFGGSALFAAIGALFMSGDTPVWGLFVFYFLSEIPIFLAMNLIWMLAEGYFTEQQSQKEFPKIAAVGLIGVSLGSGIVLANGWLGRPLTEFGLLGIWAGLAFGLLLVSWFIVTFVPQLHQDADDEDTSTSPSSPTGSFLKRTWDEFQWVRGKEGDKDNQNKDNPNRYLWLFTLVTVCNFFLLAVFDQTLANGAEHLGTEPDDLALQLAWWVFGFGLVAAVFQWLGFPRLLERIGIARINLFAPVLMLGGALVYIVFASQWLEPLFGSGDASSYLLRILIVARIFGWAAEFLFNQSLLPFIYGALPQEEMNRGRLLVEGPVTALTNGAVGLFLIGYFALFQDAAGQYGFRLDMLYFLATLAAIAMLVWSKQMIPELPKSILRRISSGGSVSERYRAELDRDRVALGELIRAVGADSLQGVQRVDALVRTLGREAAGQLATILTASGAAEETRVAAWKGLREINALRETEQIWAGFARREEPPPSAELTAAVDTILHFGRADLVTGRIIGWLKTAQGESVAVLLRLSNRLGLDWVLQAGEVVRERLKQDDDLTPESLLFLAGELGGDRLYPEIATHLRAGAGAGMAWERLGRLHFTDHRHAFDAFALLLDRAEEPGHPATRGLAVLLAHQSWLIWPLAWLMTMPRERIPDRLRPNRHVWPSLIAECSTARWVLANTVLFEAIQEDPAFRREIAPELTGVDWQTCNEPALRERLRLGADIQELSTEALLVWGLQSESPWFREPGLFLAAVEALRREKGAPLQIDLGDAQRHAAHYWRRCGALAAFFSDWEAQAKDWLARRMAQWFRAELLLWLLNNPDAERNMEERSGLTSLRLARDLLSGDDVTRDRALTALEQSGLPRNEFIVLKNDLDALLASLRRGRKPIPFLPADLVPPEGFADATALWRGHVAPALPDLPLHDTLGVCPTLATNP
uniref:Uncharacterized protein n=1 Tax=Candidatus Kentrum sp. DK TaxID=2126562 RepID=A0A450SY12_9GAMM|nr:MAG: hypothetical protein BECKDK2373B_GA0170837_107811 [Candidatus Kentron sp. DK]